MTRFNPLFAHTFGGVLADLALDGETELDISLFAPARRFS